MWDLKANINGINVIYTMYCSSQKGDLRMDKAVTGKDSFPVKKITSSLIITVCIISHCRSENK